MIFIFSLLHHKTTFRDPRYLTLNTYRVTNLLDSKMLLVTFTIYLYLYLLCFIMRRTTYVCLLTSTKFYDRHCMRILTMLILFLHWFSLHFNTTSSVYKYIYEYCNLYKYLVKCETSMRVYLTRLQDKFKRTFFLFSCIYFYHFLQPQSFLIYTFIFVIYGFLKKFLWS